ncbi:MAG TPA: DUF952 domain-containing protein [Acidimicrobiales bacterium]
MSGSPLEDRGAGAAGGSAGAAGGAGAGEILHVTTPEAWAEAQQEGAVRPPSLATEGFAHCSTRDQLAGTLAAHFPGTGPLVGLVLDPARLDDLRWEASRGGALFPHVYSPIPVDAVVAVEELR